MQLLSGLTCSLLVLAVLVSYLHAVSGTQSERQGALLLMRSERDVLQAHARDHQQGNQRQNSCSVWLRASLKGLHTAAQAPRQHDGQKGTVFCYSLVRAPPFREQTAPLLARQLLAACDGSALFSSVEDRGFNITKAYSRQEEQKAIKHQMHEMVAAGAWRKLVEMGVVDQYRWILKVDADTFVRPSTLRSAFGNLSVSSRTIISTGDQVAKGTAVDGFFLAVPVGLGTALVKDPGCDVLLSGHDEDDGIEKGSSFQSCLKNIKFDGYATLRDSKGYAKVVIDQDDPVYHEGDIGGPLKYGPKLCEDIGAALLKHFQGKSRGPLCQCTLGGQERPVCVSEDFVALHKVTSVKTYHALAKAFQ